MATPDPLHPALSRSYAQAFDTWAASQRRLHKVDQPLSVQAYRVLWTSLARWAAAQQPPVGLDALSPEDLNRFVHRREDTGHAQPPSPRHVWRVLTLIDRVQCHRAATAGRPANRAACDLLMSREDWRHANAAHKDPLPEHLSPAQAGLLVKHLASARARVAVAAGPWQSLRNLAAVALHLGAGLGPAEVRALRVDSVPLGSGRAAGRAWKLAVPAVGDQPGRETPLAPWASPLLRQWLELRAAMQVPGPLLLPSTRTGKPWSKVSHYLAVREVITAAGLGDEAAAGGSFRLRHTFALRQLRRGHEAAEVARWLGVEPVEMERYRRVVYEPVPGLA